MDDPILLNTTKRELPSRYSRWLEPQHPLPAGVRFIPVRTKSPVEYLPFITVGAFFILMGLLAPIAFVAQLRRSGFTLLTDYLLFGALFILVFLAVLSYSFLAGALRDWRLAADKRAGRLRHGLFAGQGMILLNLPHELHLLPRASFPEAGVVERSRGQRRSSLITVPFAFDGIEYEPLRFDSRLLDASPEEILPTLNEVRGSGAAP